MKCRRKNSVLNENPTAIQTPPNARTLSATPMASKEYHTQRGASEDNLTVFELMRILKATKMLQEVEAILHRNKGGEKKLYFLVNHESGMVAEYFRFKDS